MIVAPSRLATGGTGPPRRPAYSWPNRGLTEDAQRLRSAALADQLDQLAARHNAVAGDLARHDSSVGRIVRNLNLRRADVLHRICDHVGFVTVSLRDPAHTLEEVLTASPGRLHAYGPKLARTVGRDLADRAVKLRSTPNGNGSGHVAMTTAETIPLNCLVRAGPPEEPYTGCGQLAGTDVPPPAVPPPWWISGAPIILLLEEQWLWRTTRERPASTGVTLSPS